ncbi:helix-turn-helix transcriptional regulator [Psychrobacillus sp.]|uniref:helix-turn-helix transcriptional regulator n=1 Tax=Psychrobacillus sp. TaxID=1871623 RepID=UPI0028BE4FE3|nr:helix-turn-helix transcriptional regulator [Psychrobacillus sp.]
MNEQLKQPSKIFMQRLHSLESKSTSSQHYRKSLVTELRKVISFDYSCFTMVDPSTLLSTGAISDDLVEEMHSKIFEYEYLTNDFNQFEQLVQSKETVAILSEATDGVLHKSERYRMVLQPSGFRDEMRAVFISEGQCWGFLILFRRDHQPLFIDNDRILLSSITPIVGKYLRKLRLELPEKKTNPLNQETGILILSSSLYPLSYNSAAQKWLSTLRDCENIDDTILPRPIRAVCSRALENATIQSEKTSIARVSLSIPNQSYLTIQASCLDSLDQSTQIAVSFEHASPSEVMILLSDTYELSKREKDVLYFITKGFSTKEVATSLCISTYTVQDHLKSIFYKTDVSSRRELIWKMFTQYV